MRKRHILFTMVLFGAALAAGIGCHSDSGSPKQLLDRYFSSAIRQDYAATYDCYYKAYQAKVTRDEYIRHRGEASQLKAYAVTAIQEHGDTAQAQVELTFEKSPKLKRDRPVTVSVREDMVREKGEWKIRVW